MCAGMHAHDGCACVYLYLYIIMIYVGDVIAFDNILNLVMFSYYRSCLQILWK